MHHGTQTRERLLEEATELAQRKGFGATSVNDLLVATGIKKGTLYYHFPGKDDLGLAVLERAKAAFLGLDRSGAALPRARRRACSDSSMRSWRGTG